MGVIVYPKTQSEAVREALQPIAGVEGVGPCIVGTPLESVDGRYLHEHPFSEIEMDFVAARLDGITGALVAGERPVGFVARSE